MTERGLCASGAQPFCVHSFAIERENAYYRDMFTEKINNFDLKEICISGQCFRMHEDDGAFTVIAGDRYLKVSQDGENVTFFCDREEFEGFWKEYFDLDTDYEAILAAVDPEDSYLMRAADTACGVRILRQGLWEMIVTFLISQQNNIPRITKCVENICRAYGRKCRAADGTEYYAFPEPEALASLEEDALMACNLGYRSKYVVRCARKIAGGSFDLEALKTMDYEEAKAYLLTLFGVGEKVANCICLFALHHVDAFPIDTHIRQVLDAHYADGFPFDRYRGFAGIIQQYIFYFELHGDREIV